MHKSIQEKTAERIYEILPHKKELEFGCEYLDIHKRKHTFVNNFGAQKHRYLDGHNNYGDNLNIFIKEIIGQPLRLADLLLALNGRDKWFVSKPSGKNNLKFFSSDKTEVKYNLQEDNILNQSDEFCEFVYNLIK